jgi:hypothetical protein
MRFSFAVALIALVGLVAAPSAQNGVDGKWALSFETAMGTMDGTGTFKADGNALTGTIESQAGATEFKGTVKGNTIDFVLNISTPQGEIAIKMNAQVEGDSLKGTFDFGQGNGNWSGKRVK